MTTTTTTTTTDRVVIVEGRPAGKGWARTLGAKALRLLARLAWRYRSELAPASTALGLLVGAGTAHLLAPLWWWTAFPAGLVVCAAAWRWAVDRALERRYVEAVGLGTTAWLAVAWRGGVSGSLSWVLLVAATAAAVPWWTHRRRRSRVRFRRVRDNWPHHAEAAKLPGSRVQSIRATGYGCDVRLRLRPGQTVADVTQNRDRLASALSTRPGALRVELEPRRADRCIVRVVDEDPLTQPLPWPGPSAHRLRDKIVLGRREDGREVRLSLFETHLLIAGATGKGKSGMLGVVLAELVAMDGVEVWGIDLKGGQELSPWADCLRCLSTDRRGATEMLREARRLVDVRGAVNAASGARKHWPCTAEEPAIALLIDEFGQLDAEGLTLATQIVQLGRSVGVVGILATQNPSARSMGDDTTLRSQLGARICLGVHEAKDADVVLGTGMVSRGWAAHELDAPGKFLLRCPDQQHAVPRWCRGWLLTEAMVPGLVATYGSRRGPTAAEPATFSPVVLSGLDEPTDEDPLTRALREAGHAGVPFGDLLASTGLASSTLHRRLDKLRAEGRAEKAGHGRWRAVECREEAQA
ncbi:MAG TPA: FtsK/SpoIIIE domain-containing protein [Candidatus Dormibacteraeota bacterium]|nr:FtsK/SpoIIIE domain-containing protein [Candidatus Dormibacteraeota bacterium]